MRYGNHPQWEREPDPEQEPGPGSLPEPVPGAAEPRPNRFPEPVPGTGTREPGVPEPSPGRFPPPAFQRPEPVPAATAGTAYAHPGANPGEAPGASLPKERISMAEAAWLHCRRWFRRARAEQKRHGSFWDWVWFWIWDRNPESLHQLFEYTNSRQWLQPYMTGWLRRLAEWENIAYACTIGGLLKLIGNGISTGAERQLRFWVAVFIAGIAWLIYLAHH